MKHIRYLFKLGHVLIKVADLHRAVADYRALGFTVTWGSDPATAHNALLHLADGSFLELFAVPKASVVHRTLIRVGAALRNPVLLRFDLYLFSPPGPIDYAVDTMGDFAETVRRVRANRAGFSRPMRMSRTRPDGIKLTWALSLSSNVQLPFIMGPYEPELPLTEAHTTHKNGVTGIQTLIVGSADWEQTVLQYRKFYEQAGQVITKRGQKTARFVTTTAAIHLVPCETTRVEDVVLTTTSGQDVRLTHLQSSQ
jgi:catechol 2,3-dioxygenase-like lactoylglutathione lyase family enzyme